MEIKILKLKENAVVPTRGSEYAAGYDLYATQRAIIAPHTTIKVGTGIAMAIPEGMFGGIYARSGLAAKFGVRPGNCVGVIDSDYRGEIIVALHNDSNIVHTVNEGDRIAQIVIHRFEPVEFTEASELPETNRGAGGFGSTGSK